jgi:hypothetical protein
VANLFEVFQPASQAPFQQGPYGAAWGAAFGEVKDQLMAAMKLGVMARLPNFAPIDALGDLSRERQIFQGPTESTADFIAALLNAWGEWTIGGTYWGVLAQLNAAGYTGAYIAASNGYIYGPSSEVTAPDPINGIAGTPPSYTRIPPWYAASTAVYPPWNFGGANGQGDAGAPLGGPPDPTGAFWSRFVVFMDPVPSASNAWTAPSYSGWASATSYPVGTIITPTTPNGTFFTALIGGTSGGSQPTWPSIGGTVTDNGILWVYSGDFLANPTTPTSTPSTGEVGNGDAFETPPIPPGVVTDIIATFQPGKSTCVGVLALNNEARSCWAWPQGVTTNIPVSCWVSQAILSGDVPNSSALVPTAPEAVYSWLPNTAIANAGGSTYMFTIPSEYYLTQHTTANYLYSSSASSGTTGLAEPSWPTTIGNTVSDNGITWKCIAHLSSFGTGVGSTCFPAYRAI